MWPVLITLVASFAIMVALAPKPAKPKPAALEDFSFPQAEEGTAQSAVFGQVWTKGWMVLTVGNYRTRPIKSKGDLK